MLEKYLLDAKDRFDAQDTEAFGFKAEFVSFKLIFP